MVEWRKKTHPLPLQVCCELRPFKGATENRSLCITTTFPTAEVFERRGWQANGRWTTQSVPFAIHRRCAQHQSKRKWPNDLVWIGWRGWYVYHRPGSCLLPVAVKREARGRRNDMCNALIYQWTWEQCVCQSESMLWQFVLCILTWY